MHCLLCGKKLPFLRKMKNGDFCSAAHQEEFQREQNQVAVSRLLAAASTEDKNRSKIQAAKAEQAQAQAKAAPKAAPGKGKKSAKPGADGSSPACQAFFPFAFSWIEWTGRGMQLPPAKPTRPRRRLVVPALEKRSATRRLPPTVKSLLALAAIDPAPPVTLAFASAPAGDAHWSQPPTLLPQPYLPADACSWSRSAPLEEPAVSPAQPHAGGPAGEPEPAAEPGLAPEQPWPAEFKFRSAGQLAIRQLWALPVSQRLDWRPKNFPLLAVELRSDPRSDPYAAAQHEGCGLLGITPPNPRRVPSYSAALRTVAGGQDMVKPHSAPLLLPATAAGAVPSLRRGSRTTVSLTEPVAGRYPWIALFPRQIDSKLRCRAPRWKQAPVARALPRGGRLEIVVPFAGNRASAVWLTSDALPLAPMTTRVPSVKPYAPEFRYPLGGLERLGMHPKTRSGTEVLPGEHTCEPEVLASPELRRGRLHAALHNDWLTVSAGPVPIDLSVRMRAMALTARGREATAIPEVRPAAGVAITAPELRVQSARRLAVLARKMFPISLDETAPCDAKPAFRTEGNLSEPPPPAPVGVSGLRTRTTLFQTTPASKAQLWGLRFQRMAGRWQELPAPIRWSGPLMALVAAVALLGPSGMLSGSPDFATLVGRIQQNEPEQAAGAAASGPVAGAAPRNAAKPDRGVVPMPEPSATPATVAAEPASFWDSLEQKLVNRAAVALTDDFRSGLSSWTGSGNWARNWSYDAAGFVRTGPLALYTPSVHLADYRVEFLGQIERRSMGWVLRASDLRNYYACKLTIVSGGPLAKVNLVRYRVVNGVAGPARTTELPLQLQSDTVYRVLSEVRGTSFTVSVQGMIIDSWDDERLTRGGVGFFSNPGELARIRWVGVWHQYDILGRLCAFLAPGGLRTNRSL
ncbi:MAG: hypothetical protein R2762_16815 [Bryobacteraceae bacterium]